jgi:hypothetical protein
MTPLRAIHIISDRSASGQAAGTPLGAGPRRLVVIAAFISSAARRRLRFGRRRSSLLLLPLSQAHSRAATLVDELDAGGFQTRAYAIGLVTGTTSATESTPVRTTPRHRNSGTASVPRITAKASVWVRSANLQPRAVAISAFNRAPGFSTSFKKRILNNKVATIGSYKRT